MRELVPGEAIVGFEEDATRADLGTLNGQADARTEEDLPRSDANLVDLPRDLGVAGAAWRYEASPIVENAEPNVLIYALVTPNDPSSGKRWGPHETGLTVGAGVGDADIDAPEAWNKTTGTVRDRPDPSFSRLKCTAD